MIVTAGAPALMSTLPLGFFEIDGEPSANRDYGKRRDPVNSTPFTRGGPHMRAAPLALAVVVLASLFAALAGAGVAQTDRGAGRAQGAPGPPEV